MRIELNRWSFVKHEFLFSQACCFFVNMANIMWQGTLHFFFKSHVHKKCILCTLQTTWKNHQVYRIHLTYYFNLSCCSCLMWIPERYFFYCLCSRFNLTCLLGYWLWSCGQVNKIKKENVFSSAAVPSKQKNLDDLPATKEEEDLVHTVKYLEKTLWALKIFVRCFINKMCFVQKIVNLCLTVCVSTTFYLWLHSK